MIAEEMAVLCYANRLRRASRAISRHYDLALKPLDLRVSQLSVLAAASVSSGTLTIVEIAEKLGMDRSTLSRNFDPLVRRGLVVLGPEERHRARRVELTEAGATLLQQAYPLWRAAQDGVAESITGINETVRLLDPISIRLGDTNKRPGALPLDPAGA